MYREQGAGGESVDPVLVPQEVQEVGVQRGLEVGHLQGVVLATVHPKVLYLLQGDGLVLGRPLIRRVEPLNPRKGEREGCVDKGVAWRK